MSEPERAARVEVRRRVPVALPWLLGLALLGTVLDRTVWPGLIDLVDRGDLQKGEVWRVVTPLLVQTGPLAAVVIVFVLTALVGWLAERWFGSARMAALYLGGGVVGNVLGSWWDPHGAGIAVGGCGVLGGFAVWWLRMRRSGPVTAGGWVLVIAVLLAFGRDIFGVTLLAGALLGVVVLRDVPAVYRGKVRG